MNELVMVQNQQVVTNSRNVARHFGKRHDNVLTTIGGLLKNKETKDMFYETNYIDEQNNQSYPMYLINRDGFMLLAMGFTGQKALEWKLKYIQAFNVMEKTLQEQNRPRTEAEILLQSAKMLVEQERKMKALEAKQEEQGREVQRIRDVMALRPDNWRKDTGRILQRIAHNIGTEDAYREIRNESYELLETRMRCNLSLRLKNAKQRMFDSGGTKAQCKALNNIDIIAKDPKLIEGYISVVKDMAIHYGIA